MTTAWQDTFFKVVSPFDLNEYIILQGGQPLWYVLALNTSWFETESYLHLKFWIYKPCIANFYAGFCKKQNKTKKCQKIFFLFLLPDGHFHLQSLKNAIAFFRTSSFQLFVWEIKETFQLTTWFPWSTSLINYSNLHISFWRMQYLYSCIINVQMCFFKLSLKYINLIRD